MAFATLRVTARNEAVQIDRLDLFRNEILQKSFKNRFDSKFFVYLPLIVRGEIRTVEGNLCLYPANEIWKILKWILDMNLPA